MIPSTLTLIVAATSTVLSANALPIFSGFFASPATPAPRAIQQRDLTDGQLAQGTNAFFKTLLLEDVCTPGQVGCINNNTATCSPEGNWEITPCTGSTTCAALPASTDASSQSLVVKCVDPSAAVSAIVQAGGSQDLAVDYSIDTAPFNATTVDLLPSDDGSIPTATDSFTDVPTSTDMTADPSCTPGDGSDDGSNDGSDDGSNDGSDDGSNDGSDDGSTDLPTGTDAGTDPTGTCTDEPAEPTETEYITVIAFPDPSNSDSFTFSTIEPTDEVPTDTLTEVASATESVTQVAPVDAPTDSNTDTAFPTDTTTDTVVPTGTDAGVPAPTDTTAAPCVHPDPAQTSGDSTDTALPTDTTTDTATETATTTDTAFTGEPTTLVVPPNFSIVSGPAPDVNTFPTFAIPAPSDTPVPIRRRGMQRKVRRSS